MSPTSVKYPCPALSVCWRTWTWMRGLRSGRAASNQRAMSSVCSTKRADGPVPGWSLRSGASTRMSSGRGWRGFRPGRSTRTVAATAASSDSTASVRRGPVGTKGSEVSAPSEAGSPAVPEEAEGEVPQVVAGDADAQLPGEERNVGEVDTAVAVEVAACIVLAAERCAEAGDVGLVGVAVAVEVGGAPVADAVGVAVGLVVVLRVGAVVAGVAPAVAVAVCLIRIRGVGAVVDRVGDAVAVAVGLRRGRAGPQVGDEREPASRRIERLLAELDLHRTAGAGRERDPDVREARGRAGAGV